jgi:pre-mRNA-splicing helicase BRR2
MVWLILVVVCAVFLYQNIENFFFIFFSSDQMQEKSKKPDYSYQANSNLVLKQSRAKQSDEPTGQAESLYGKITKHDFGSRAGRERVPIPKTKQPKADAISKQTKLNLDGFENLNYRPKTMKTMQNYQLILILIKKYLGDYDESTLKSCVDSCIEVLFKYLKDGEKLKEIQEIVSNEIPEFEFAQLIQLGKQITDYSTEPAQEDAREEYGVAVVFEESDSDSQIDEVQSVNSDDDEGGEKNEEAEDDLGPSDDIVLKHDIQKKEQLLIDPATIDAFWLQRLLAKYFTDPITCQQKTTDTFEILDSTRSLRDVENDLVELFDYEKFDLVKTLTENRNSIVWCTKLSKTDSDIEKLNIQSEMKSLGLEYILKSLVSPEIQQKDDVEMAPVEKEIASEAQPKQKVDLEALAFDQSGHFMSNKKVKLPPGSIKKSKKGYDEIHIPPPEMKPMDKNEKLISIQSMPHYCKSAFPNTKSLNRVQSGVYPIAFESDENMLLCAPTGAGK